MLPDNNRFEKIKSALEYLFHFGVILDVRNEDAGYKIILKPEDLKLDEGFEVSVLIGWKRLMIEFLPGKKAGLLLLEMGKASTDNKCVFAAVAESVIDKKGSVILTINGSSIEPGKPDDWPETWRNLKITLTSPVIDPDGDLSENNNLIDLIKEWSVIFFSMFTPLLPLKEINSVSESNNGTEQVGLAEGALTRITANRYERSQINRQACIAIHGTHCAVCGFNFGKQYGKYGEGFIEVHHIIPVSDLGDGYRINPVKDLIPVCPNCHAMLHRRTPPYSIEELKLLINNS